MRARSHSGIAPPTKGRIAGSAGEFYQGGVAKHDEDPGAPQRRLDELAEIDHVTGKLANRPPRTMTVTSGQRSNWSLRPINFDMATPGG
jgi:hypothetical protein